MKIKNVTKHQQSKIPNAEQKQAKQKKKQKRQHKTQNTHKKKHKLFMLLDKRFN